MEWASSQCIDWSRKVRNDANERLGITLTEKKLTNQLCYYANAHAHLRQSQQRHSPPDDHKGIGRHALYYKQQLYKQIATVAAVATDNQTRPRADMRKLIKACSKSLSAKEAYWRKWSSVPVSNAPFFQVRKRLLLALNTHSQMKFLNSVAHVSPSAEEVVNFIYLSLHRSQHACLTTCTCTTGDSWWSHRVSEWVATVRREPTHYCLDWIHQLVFMLSLRRWT